MSDLLGLRAATCQCQKLGQATRTSGNPYPFTNPPFDAIPHGYDMDVTKSGMSFGKMLYPCHVHVISFFQKRYSWI